MDKVPGWPKVGRRTEGKWLLECGSLDALVARAGEIKGVVGENLRSSLDWLPRGRELLTIKKDCDLAGYIDGLPALEAIAMGAGALFLLRPVTSPHGKWILFGFVGTLLIGPVAMVFEVPPIQVLIAWTPDAIPATATETFYRTEVVHGL